MNPNPISAALPESIETRRLVLRRPVATDAGALTKLADNPRIAAMLANLPSPYTLEDAFAFILERARSDRQHAFLITLKGSALVGVTGIKLQDGRPPELGYWIAEDHWGAGFASEAAAAFLDAIFATGLAPVVTARVLAHNPASCRVLEKLGFRFLDERIEDCGDHPNQPVRHFEIEAPARRRAP